MDQGQCGGPLHGCEGKKAPWACPRRPHANISCVCSRALSVTSGTQPVCKCRDRCEKEPSFTCAPMASPTITAATWTLRPAPRASRWLLCHLPLSLHLAQHQPLTPETTVHPTTAPPETPADATAPALLNHPAHQSVTVGETVSFLCDVGGPAPARDHLGETAGRRENVVMRPNHVMRQRGGHQHRPAGHLQRPSPRTLASTPAQPGNAAGGPAR